MGNKYCLLILILNSYTVAQLLINHNSHKMIINEKNNLHNINKDYAYQMNDEESLTNFQYNNFIIINNGLPNFENQNGIYPSKGLLSLNSFLIKYSNDFLFISLEPTIINYSSYKEIKSNHSGPFKYSNSQPIKIKNQKFRNTGIIFKFHNHQLGFGNWNRWWGPGIHNSLIMSNNSDGIPAYFIGTSSPRPIFGELKYSFNYFISDYLINETKSQYFISAYNFVMNYGNIEFGKSKLILSGGYDDIPWNFQDALYVIANNKNMRYWDQINQYYISTSFPENGLKVFIELGFISNPFAQEKNNFYSKHTIAANIGFRKYGLFYNNNFMFGLEYTRLAQGPYYDKLPTPNWYDNIKYDYSTYNGRHWGSHSGTDSDDLLIFFGYIKQKIGVIYGFNFERHGITYSFPPEVKLESKISMSYKHRNILFSINYENEYYEHYGFVDVNRNVWAETFEPGSLQRTHTLLISLQHTLSF